MTLHELRHTYASTMVRNGAPLIIVAQALGRSDTRTVEKHYAHLAPSYSGHHSPTSTRHLEDNPNG
ncbi:MULTISPECIES: tyrosine-type recombinase/integrase [Mesorhizobium]|uniref:tyrosine-type recombinase/integrase n=1 Tax=Mesorhizobium TaxID=68287 RepID=UPI001FCDBB43|nr:MULTISPECIES: tyrosine-type recombinase/integrase [Mesorhizobium]MDF3233418.1 tyrosine-type recombinase/integrase [Mesorhizobium sp. DSM 30133]